MRVRDRLVVAVIVAIVLAGVMWAGLVSPERGKVTSLNAQIATQRAALAGAQAQVVSARHAVAGYVGHLHQIDEVIKAVPRVPAEAEVIATIDKLTGTKVEPDFRELDVGVDTPTGTGPVALGLTFTYWTTYRGLQSFLSKLDNLTATDGLNVNANGRLFTVTSVSLQPLASNQAPANVTRASISAQVYLQGGATVATAAAGATGATGAAS